MAQNAVCTQLPAEQTEQILSCILDMGELLLVSGAEVMRVEDTVQRLCAAYGFVRADVFTITSSIVLTVHTESGRVFTQTRRIVARDTDLERVANVNALSRKLCGEPADAQTFRGQLEEIRRGRTYSRWVHMVCYGGISAGFSLFFGGTVQDAVAALLSGLVLFGVLQFCRLLKLNSILESILASGLTALAVLLLVSAGIGQHADKITIGNIMVLIPGLAFTNSLRDLINGDTISGILGISEAIVKAVAIAIGFAAVLTQVGG